MMDSTRFIDDVDVVALAARVPTPFYAYSAGAIRQRITSLRGALQGLDARICYAVKANSNLAVLQLVAQQGIGADIVSAGEMHRALHAGIPAEHIVFSGVGKTADEMAQALMTGVWRFNVESRDELRTLQAVAAERNVVALAAVRINPDVDAGTHAKISTGKAENKFGVTMEEARDWFAQSDGFPNVRLDGLHVHIGSQILKLQPFRLAMQQVAAFAAELVASGHPIASIDVGGGLGVRYRHGHDEPLCVNEYAAMLRATFADFGGTLVLEPGRYLVAEAGVLITRVVRIKTGSSREFLVADAAMNDLQRPALYDAWHEIIPLHDRGGGDVLYDVVGPVCETGDTFAVQRSMPRCQPGDLLLIANAGAYGSSMSSNYNSRPLVAEIMLDRGRHAVVRRRQSFEEMIAGESRAEEWLTA